MDGVDRHAVRAQRPRCHPGRPVTFACVARAGLRGICRTEPLGTSPRLLRKIMAAAQLAPYRVVAFNTAHASENKIHDDATARRFGFSGGLVPGVDVYGYMTHMPVEHWGRSWLERGTADCRLYKPVYHGDEAVVTATGASGSLEITLESRGARCATGIAGLPSVAPSPPDVAAFRAVPQRRDRAPADERSVAVGTWLGLDPYPVTREMAEQYLAASSE